MIGITAGEAGDPGKTVPRAIKQVFWRILIFYVGMMFFIGILLPYNDSRLLQAGSTTAKSPLTLAMLDANIRPAADVINALIVISVISAGNSSLYVASRTMLYLARNRKAPAIFGRVDKRGVPWSGLIFSNLAACLSFLSISSDAGTVYEALITLSGVATFIVWGTIALTHIRFRQAMAAQGQSIDDLQFKAMWYPYGTYLCLAVNIFLVLIQGNPLLLLSPPSRILLILSLGYTAFLNPFSAKDFVVNYILLPVFAAMYFGYKFWFKTKILHLKDIDLFSGRRVASEEPDKPEKKGLWPALQRFWVG